MQRAFVVLQEPDELAPQFSSPVAVRAKSVHKAYLVLVNVDGQREVQFIDYLDGFLSQHLKSCRRDRNLIFTSDVMSFDPVKKITDWASEWLGSPVVATPL